MFNYPHLNCCFALQLHINTHISLCFLMLGLNERLHKVSILHHCCPHIIHECKHRTTAAPVQQWTSTSVTVLCHRTAITPFMALSPHTEWAISLAVTTPVGMKGQLVTSGSRRFRGHCKASGGEAGERAPCVHQREEEPSHVPFLSCVSLSWPNRRWHSGLCKRGINSEPWRASRRSLAALLSSLALCCVTVRLKGERGPADSSHCLVTALPRVTFKIETTSSVAPLCPVATHHMETMSAWSDLAPKCCRPPHTPPLHLPPSTAVHPPTHTHRSLTHVNCVSCQVTANRICQLPDVDVLASCLRADLALLDLYEKHNKCSSILVFCFVLYIYKTKYSYIPICPNIYKVCIK